VARTADPIRAARTRRGLVLAAVAASVGVVAFLVGSQSTGSVESPGPSPSALTQRWASSVINGSFELKLVAAKPTFRSDEAIDVVASVLYQGPEDSIAVGFGTLGPVVLTIPGILAIPDHPSMCIDAEMDRGAPVSERLGESGADGRFFVSHGLRRITATADVRIGGCNGGHEILETSIVIAVIDDDQDLPIWTDPRPAVACVLNRLTARVALHPEDGFGFIDHAGVVHGVQWPPGWSARRVEGGPLLFGEEGKIVAQEGDVLVYSGSGAAAADGLIHPCLFPR
jgi:hypothetical protein